MKRNRSVRTLPLDNLNLLKHPLPEPSSGYNREGLYFGEEIAKDRTPSLSSDGSDTILRSVRDLGNSKSSSSSLSWGEEYKSEASIQVRNELERMDRVLRGAEPIPDYYDQEEYKEWMDFFPNLCVFGIKIATRAQTSTKNCSACDEILSVRSEVNCDNLKTNQNGKKSVIKNIYESPKIVSDKIDVDSFLKVSPLGGPLLPRRQSSSRSLISSQISSSKWLKEDEYNSLPFLPGGRNGKKGAPRGILKNTLLLPPIETSQFRSISATPRRESKSLSALSEQKYSGFKRKTKDCK